MLCHGRGDGKSGERAAPNGTYIRSKCHPSPGLYWQRGLYMSAARAGLALAASAGPPLAFAVGRQISLRRRSLDIAREELHEGTHASDFLAEMSQATRADRTLLDKQAYWYERRLQLWTGRRVDFNDVRDMLLHILATTN